MTSLDHAGAARNDYRRQPIILDHDHDHDAQLTRGGREVRRRARWLSVATCNMIAALAGVGQSGERGR